MTTLKENLGTDPKIQILKNLNCGNQKAIHFIGLGGIGMSGIAQILTEYGYRVSGSDIKDSPILCAMTNNGAITFVGHNEENVEDAGLIVVSSAIKEDNPELKRARELSIPIVHRSEVLSSLMQGEGLSKRPVSIGVTGTHGKTTTTGMISFILEEADLKPTILVGGIMQHINSNSKLGSGSYFVAELDESDGTIENYSPDITVINNLELDHVDYYQNGLDDLITKFVHYLNSLPEDAKVIVNKACKGIQELIRRVPSRKFISYSLHQDVQADYMAKNETFDGEYTQFELHQNQEKIGNIKLKTIGHHNIENALGAIAASMSVGVPLNIIQRTLLKFLGVKRRFQHTFNICGAKIIDDYAHHPTEIMTTLEAARKIIDNEKKGRLKVVFQPHRFTRMKSFWNDFNNALRFADKVFIVDVYGAGEDELPGITSKNLVQTITSTEAIWLGGPLEAVAQEIIKDIQQDDMIITMGAGNITKLGNIMINLVNEG